MLLALLFSGAAAMVLWLFPAPMFPSGTFSPLDKLLVFAIPAYALTEILLAAQAYRYDIATTVRARAVIEPWTISIMAGVFFYSEWSESGLALAYLASVVAGLVAALVPFLRSYGLPQNWRPHPGKMARMTMRAFPLADRKSTRLNSSP